MLFLSRRTTSVAGRKHLFHRFDLDEMPEPECKAEMHYNRNNILVLAEVFELPETFACSQSTVADKLEGLCLLLRQTA